MNDITTFEFNDHLVRTVIINNQIWWLGKDVCQCLKLKYPRYAFFKLDDDEKNEIIVKSSTGGLQNTTVINESGVYHLVFLSNKKVAKTFKKWVTKEILPSIYKIDPQVHQQPPVRDIIDYQKAAEGLENVNDLLIKSLLKEKLAEKLKQFNITTSTPRLVSLMVRAKELGITTQQMVDDKRNGVWSLVSKLNRDSRFEAKGKNSDGVNQYEQTKELDSVILAHFNNLI